MGEHDIPLHALVCARVLPVVLGLSLLARGAVPLAVALSLGAALSAALAPVAGGPSLALPEALAPALARELCIGGAFALALGLALLAVPWAVGLAHRDLSGPVAKLYALAACFVVLSLGGHRALLVGLGESYADAPLAGATGDLRGFVLGTVQLATDALVTALSFALPLLVAAWLAELALALLVRLSSPRAAAVTSAIRPILLTLIGAALLPPTVARAPEAVRAAISVARQLTRGLAR